MPPTLVGCGCVLLNLRPVSSRPHALPPVAEVLQDRVEALAAEPGHVAGADLYVPAPEPLPYPALGLILVHLIGEVVDDLVGRALDDVVAYAPDRYVPPSLVGPPPERVLLL